MINNADQAQRQQALDIRFSYIVEAPAGSGKTELLTQRFLALLAHVRQDPEEIVALTFTRKAAAEMRHRILQALENAQSSTPPDTAHGLMTWQLARQVLARDERESWQLQDNPNRLRIQTIDALCMQFVRQLPILSQLGGQPTIADTPEYYYRLAARELLESLASQNDWQRPLMQLLLHLDNHHEKCEALFVELLAKRDQWLPYMQQPTHAAGKLRNYLEHNLKRLRQRCIHQLNTICPPNLFTELAQLAEYTGRTATWSDITELLLTKDNQWRKRVDVKLGFPPAEKSMKKRMEELLVQCSDQETLRKALVDLRLCPEENYSATQWEIIEALLILLPLLTAQLKLVFQDSGVTDFIEVAQAALTALSESEAPTDLALSLDAQIQHLLIDEFQDTSITQFKLLERLTLEWQPQEHRTLFLVGDPMQSIYRFRQGEVGLFLRARQYGINAIRLIPLTLSVNFRSGAKLIDWVNTVFTSVFPSETDINTGAIPFSPSVATHQYDVQIEWHPVLAESQAETVVSLIQDIRRRDPNNQIAILVRSRNHLADILPVLSQNGIDYQATEIEKLQQRSIIQDLIALTRALLHLADRTAWLSILRAPWCGLTLNDLFCLANGDKENCIINQLLAFIENCDESQHLSDDGQQRLTAFMNIITVQLQNRARQPLSNWIENTWQALGGPDCIDDESEHKNARLYFAMLARCTGDEQVLNWQKFSVELAKLYAQSTPTTACPIQVMTIHKAKGLEFDTVILPSLERQSAKDGKQLLLWMENIHDQEQPEWLLAPIQPAHAKQDNIYQYLETKIAEKNAHEMRRLLYVAATRAKSALHLVFKSEKVINNGSFLSMIQHKINKEKSVFSLVPADKPRDDSSESNGKNEKRIDRGLKRLSLDFIKKRAHKNPPALRVPPFFKGGEQIVSEPSHTNRSNRLSRLTGTLIHQILCEISQPSAQPLVFVADYPRWQRYFQQHGIVDKSDMQLSMDRVETAVTRTLADPRGRWILDHRHAETASEWAITTIVQDRPRQFVIDRTFIDATGTRWIIDYKTADYDGENLEDFLIRQVEQYRSQLQQYAQALRQHDSHSRSLRAGLYFVMSSQWQEIAV